MSDLIEEIKRKRHERAKSTAITTVCLILGIIALLAYSVHDDRSRQRELYTTGGAVGIENKTNHKVTVQLFVNEESDVQVLSQTIEPQGHWVVRDSMSKYEVSNFPPANWLDSGYLVFDDTLLLKHATHPVWNISYKDHCINDGPHWRYESLVVRRASRYHPALYRPLRVYYITDEDYERAVIANKPKAYLK